MAILHDWRVSRGLGDLGSAMLDNKEVWGGCSTGLLIADSGLVVDLLSGFVVFRYPKVNGY